MASVALVDFHCRETESGVFSGQDCLCETADLAFFPFTPGGSVFGLGV